MLQRLSFVYLHHFKLVALLNLGISIFLTYLFLAKGFDKVNLYNISMAYKLVAYVLTLMIEKLIFTKRSIYYRNLGLSYRKLLGVFFGLDFFCFLLMLISSWLWMNFI